MFVALQGGIHLNFFGGAPKKAPEVKEADVSTTEADAPIVGIDENQPSEPHYNMDGRIVSESERKEILQQRADREQP